MSRNATVWRSPRRTALRGGRSRNTGKASGQVDFRKPVVKSTSNDGLDPEVISWMSRVDASGGSVDSDTIKALNNWINKIKSKEGLRTKLKRVNLFCGDDLLSSLIPIIADAGASADSNNNFITSDYVESGNNSGLKVRTTGGSSKYIDTGLNFANADLDFNNGHFAIHSTGASLSSSYQEWGGRSWASMGSSLIGSGSYHFRWGKTSLTINNLNPQSGTSTGFYLGNVSSSEISMHQNGRKISSQDIASINNTPSSAADKNFYIFRRNSTTDHSDFEQSINFYSIGLSLTDEESKFLYDSVVAFNKELKRQYFYAKNLEAWEWINHRVHEVVGDVSTYYRQSSVNSADAWITAVKSNGLIDKIDRANLFLGGNVAPYGYLGAFVPLIIKKGFRTDKNYNFIQKDYQISNGLKGDGIQKYIDIGMSANQNFSDLAGHLSINTKSETINTSSEGIGLIGTIGPRSGGANSSDVYINLNKHTDGSYRFNTHFGKNDISSLSLTTSKSFFLLNSNNQASYSNFLNGIGVGNQVGSSNSWVTSELKVNDTDLNINVFSAKNADGLRGYSDQFVNFYSVGEKLSPTEITTLNGAVNGLDNSLALLEASDSEVWDWANVRVPENGGAVTQQEVTAVNTWMTTVKAVSGLRGKLKRVNFNLGSSNSSKLVPLIKDHGESLDEALGTPNLSSTSLSDYNYNVTNSNHYELGSDLTDSEKTTLSTALAALNNSTGRDLDSEVYTWAYTTVPNNGGTLTQATIKAVNTFMTSIKAESGLRSKITRLNLFAGQGLKSAQVPLIADDSGSDIDTINNFTDSDLDEGLQGGGGSYIDTGVNSANASSITSQDNHVMVNIKGELSTQAQAIAISNYDGSSKAHLSLSVTNGLAKFLHDFNQTDNKQGAAKKINPDSGTFIGSKIGSTSNLYSNGVSVATGDDGANRDVGSGNFQIFAANNVASFPGRITAYSIGLGLTSSQATAFHNALKALDITLRRGAYKASDSEVWDWANIRVPANGGTISQSIVDSVNKWMIGVKSIYNLRESIKRCNLFVGKNLAAALVPVIKDLGPDADINEGFVEADYVSMGASAGLRSSGGKSLSTGVNASAVLNSNYNMSFRSTDAYSDVTISEPIMGATSGIQARGFYNDYGSTSFIHGSDGFGTYNIKEYINYIAGYISYPLSQVGTALGYNASNRPAPIFGDIERGSLGKNMSPGWMRFRLGDLDVSAENDAWYGTTQAAGGRGLYTIKASSLYSNSSQSKVKFYLDGKLKHASTAFERTNNAPNNPIRIFGASQQFEPFVKKTESNICINFYCFGTGPESPSSGLEDVLDSNFQADKMYKLLVDLDCDLGRLHVDTSGLTSTLDTEVAHWANEVVPTYGGYLRGYQIDAVNEWMKIIKAQPGLRQRLTRVNLFVGNNLQAALVPIIRDAGLPTDLNKGLTGFRELDYNIVQGLSPKITDLDAVNSLGDVSKFLGTGVNVSKAGSKLLRGSGHISIASSDSGKKLYPANVSNIIPISVFPRSDQLNWWSAIWMNFNSKVNGSLYNTFQSVWSQVTTPFYNFINTLELAPNHLVTTVKQQNYQTQGTSAIITYNQGRQPVYTERVIQSELEMPDSEVNLFGFTYGKDASDHQGSTVPSNYYQESSVSNAIYALTPKKYDINLISSKTKSELNEIIKNEMGDGWEIADWDDFSSSSLTGLTTVLSEFGIYDPNQETFVDPEEAIGYVTSGGSVYNNGQYLAHWLNKKSLSEHSYSLVSGKQYHDNYWALRKVQFGDGVKSTASMLVKNTSIKRATSYATSAQSWGASISYYSMGDTLSAAEVTVLENAYKKLCEKINRSQVIEDSDRFLPK